MDDVLRTARLLTSPDPIEAEIASELLREHGIPSISDRVPETFATLGYTTIERARPDLLVPADALDRAREILREAWDPSALTDEVALASPAAVEVPARANASTRRLFLLVGLGAVIAYFLVRDHLARSVV